MGLPFDDTDLTCGSARLLTPDRRPRHKKTVEFHAGNTIEKLGASSRITAVIMGIKNGFISL